MQPIFDALENRSLMSRFGVIHHAVHAMVHVAKVAHIPNNHIAVNHVNHVNKIAPKVIAPKAIAPKAIASIIAKQIVDPTIPFIVGTDVGAAQNALNFTSNTFQNVLFGTGGWNGIQQIANRFSVTGNQDQLVSDLTNLSFRMPYGNQQLLNTWLTDLQSLQSGSLTPTTTIFFSSNQTSQAIADVLYADLQTYLSDNLGTNFNILKSVINWDSDNLLTYNGFVGSNDLT